jgi:hypothetical protein
MNLENKRQKCEIYSDIIYSLQFHKYLVSYRWSQWSYTLKCIPNHSNSHIKRHILLIQINAILEIMLLIICISIGWKQMHTQLSSNLKILHAKYEPKVFTPRSSQKLMDQFYLDIGVKTDRFISYMTLIYQLHRSEMLIMFLCLFCGLFTNELYDLYRAPWKCEY